MKGNGEENERQEIMKNGHRARTKEDEEKVL